MGADNKQSMWCGDFFDTANGICEVVDYKSVYKVTVRFDDGYEATTSAGHIREGVVGHPMRPITYGVGYFGVGDFILKDGMNRKAYNKWSAMLQRCYDLEYQDERNPTYKGCSVSEEWMCFQNYAKDYYEMLGNNSTWDLDKDILIRGNKIYSRETCVALPRELNVLTVGSDAARGEYPKGVCWKTAQQKFHAYCSNGTGKQIHLGYYDDSYIAWTKYKVFKENHIKTLATKWQDQIDPRAYQALMNYEVLIAD